MQPDYDAQGTVMTVKVGSLGAWHAVHILLSLLTLGGWLIVYGIHAIVSATTRPSITVTVPPGGRIEYYRGHPNVLGPDEYLDRPARRNARIALIAFGVLAVVVMAVIGVYALA